MFRWNALLDTPGRRKQSAFFRALTECAEGVQRETGATVAVVLRGSSGNYLDVAFLFGFGVSWVGLLVILFLPHPIHVYLVPLDVMLLFILGAWLCGRTRLRGWLTRRRRQRRQVKTAAHAAFFEEGVYHAKGGNGVLIYWSRLERRVEVVAGPGVLKAVPTRDWNATLFALRRAVHQPRPGAAFVAQLRQLGQLLARHLPPDEAAKHAEPLVGSGER
jgi:putative membrane protein